MAEKRQKYYRYNKEKNVDIRIMENNDNDEATTRFFSHFSTLLAVALFDYLARTNEGETIILCKCSLSFFLLSRHNVKIQGVRLYRSQVH
jgi:hypothetical protein